MNDAGVLFYSNISIAVSYVAIAAMIAVITKKSPMYRSYFETRNISYRRKHTAIAALCMGGLFGSFIFLCGLTHLVSALLNRNAAATFGAYASLHVVLMILCAIASAATAIIMVKIFPAIVELMNSFELTDEGSVSHMENYIVQVVDRFNESIVVLSPEYNIVRGNRSTQLIFGDGFVGKSLDKFVHPEDYPIVYKALQGLSSRYNDDNCEIQYRIHRIGDASSEYRWVKSTLCRNAAMLDTACKEVSMITRDIQGEVDAKAAVEDLNAAKLRYISCTAHDLKTPLQSFSFALELLRSTALTEEQSDYLNNAQVSLELMHMTISQAMDISKALSGGQLLPHRDTCSLSKLLQQIKIIIAGYGCQVPVHYNLSPAVCDSIITDMEWLRQIILNFLTNACKYTESGWIRLDISLDPLDEKSLLVEVTDTGIGIKSESYNDVFSMYGQLQKGQPTGTGLGLYDVKLRIEGLGGTCGVKPNNTSACAAADDLEAGNARCEKGSIFWCKLPYIPDKFADSESLIYPSKAIRRGCADMTNVFARSSSDISIQSGLRSTTTTDSEKRVLSAIVVDDASSICKMLSKLLKNAGFEDVETYSNGSQGLEAMKRKQVDLVFTDVQMPIMTGPEMTERFRYFEEQAIIAGNRQERQIVVAVTANGEELSSSVGGKPLFDQICPKPLDIKQLRELLRSYKCTGEA